MTLPLTVRSSEPGGGDCQGQTRDVSFRGLYFLAEADFAPGAAIEFILTLPRMGLGRPRTRRRERQ